MPLETATYISQLVSTNPPGTDSEAQGANHLRLIKSALQATFPNFTAAALNSTQAAIDAVTGAFSAGSWPLGAGTVGAPALHLLSDTTTGVYSTGAGHIDIAIGGVQLLDLSSAGLNLVTGTLQFGGVNIFPLGSSAYGAGSVTSAALAAGSVLTAALGASQVTYAKLQNETGLTLLGNPTGSGAAPAEVTLTAPLTFSGTSLKVTQVQPVYSSEFTAGSGTFTTPTDTFGRLPLYLHVRIYGGGGGGGAASTNVGGTGGNTAFGAWTAVGGGGGGAGPGVGAVGGSGGSGGANGTDGSLMLRLTGQNGGPASSNTPVMPGNGGSTPFGPGGVKKDGANSGPGQNASAAGGGGSGAANTGTNSASAGGGAGEFAEFIITTVASSYSYTVGAAGAGGAAGTQAGGSGATGLITIMAHWQ